MKHFSFLSFLLKHFKIIFSLQIRIKLQAELKIFDDVVVITDIVWYSFATSKIKGCNFFQIWNWAGIIVIHEKF